MFDIFGEFNSAEEINEAEQHNYRKVILMQL